ncbi:OmpA family protein [Vulgatibacter incomptus]|uniref:OmpA family protein n=1 Tax=Vulgatibacter incomptus TaxID=1391653 RepID=A0A0K1PDD1_9BACT|nr:OmpA family protein [Vulgatibacter incomptus]AKU91411.1 OmpA family protein [Vulgatibacter incomptus]
MDLRALRILLPVAFLAIPIAAHADDISVEVIPKALFGQGKPGLVLHVNKPVASATAELRGPDGKALTLRATNIPPGSKRELLIDAPVGKTRYEGTLDVVFANGTSGSMPVAFEVLVSKGFTIDPPPKEWFDAKAGTLSFTMTGVADHCEYDVLFDGKPARQGVERFSGEPAGTKLTLSWPTHGDDDTVLRIQFTCHDPDGFFAPMVTHPWALQIPHEEVIFASGKSEVTPGERPKLDAALEKVAVAIRRYGQVVPIKLYVAGHTDTVGDGATNRSLSVSRARAIAAYFRGKGVKIPIFFAGFGADQLAVPTPDQTDEPRNRRADYVLKVDPPSAGSWSKL